MLQEGRETLTEAEKLELLRRQQAGTMLGMAYDRLAELGEPDQQRKCMRGEHECNMATPLLMLPTHTGHQVQQYVCRHCRCVFVGKQEG